MRNLMLTLALMAPLAHATPPFNVPPPFQDGGASNATAESSADSRATSVSGSNSAATGGVGVGVGTGGSASVTAGSDVDLTTGGVTVVTESGDYPAAGAAGIMTVSCQEGASGQSFSGGAASVMESAMCQSLKMAEVHKGYWQMYGEMGDEARAANHKRLMDKYLKEASDAADFVYYPKVIGSTFLSILPIGLLFLLL